jgi:sugar transferase (PEP-CTERM/EpsH1 system associated)
MPKVPLVAHVIFQLDTGGMENGLVNIINRTPAERYRHAIICITDAREFAKRITVPDVPIISLRQGPGHSFWLYLKLWRVLRRLDPTIVHTRNLAALEAQIPAAFLLGTKRVHGEHGRDVFDLQGRSRKYNALRRLIRPLVHRYIVVSQDLEIWLRETVGVAPARLRQIYNGVALDVFHKGDASHLGVPAGFLVPGTLVVGSVGRLAAVKDHATLIRAFSGLISVNRDAGNRLRLVIAGDGPCRAQLLGLVAELDLTDKVWFAGDRDDVPEILRMFDIFVLPSLGEGISNTVLEAMATGLPVVATRVGGNPELIADGVNGWLVPAGDSDALSAAIGRYTESPELRLRHGQAGRQIVESRFTWGKCLAEYLVAYDELLAGGSPHSCQRG